MEHHTNKIGLVGYANTGKDTLAKIFEQHGYTHKAFALPLLEYVCDINPIIGYENNALVYFCDAIRKYGYDVAKRLYPEIRRVMVSIGQSSRKHIDDNLWIDKILPITPRDTTEKIIISDVRYPEEETRIRQCHGIIIGVVRKGIEPPNNEEKTHIPSLIRTADIVIGNNGTIEDLNTIVATLISIQDTQPNTQTVIQRLTKHIQRIKTRSGSISLITQQHYVIINTEDSYPLYLIDSEDIWSGLDWETYKCLHIHNADITTIQDYETLLVLWQLVDVFFFDCKFDITLLRQWLLQQKDERKLKTQTIHFFDDKTQIFRVIC